MELACFKKKKKKKSGSYKIKIETQVFVKNTADRFARFSCFSREFFVVVVVVVVVVVAVAVSVSRVSGL